MLTSFKGNLYGPVDVGHIFVISGKTVDGAILFYINLASGRSDESDIPLHISAHFHSNTILRNAQIELAWGEEEIDENLLTSPNPIMPGWDFKVLILTGDEKFHVAINDQPFCTFDYRLPLEMIQAIVIGGDVQKIFQVDHRKVFPSPYPMIHESLSRGPQMSFDVPRAMFPGHVFVIQGIPSGNHNGGFYFHLNQGVTKRQMFHVSVRFNNRTVVFNSQSEALEWRKDEEKTSSFPFALDQLFKLAVAITDNAFIVAVNGEVLFSYSYRTHNSFLSNLSGIKIVTHGMQLEVQGVDHLNMGTSDCEGFEDYSNPDILLE